MLSTIIKRRSVLSIAGPDRLSFLNGLISNDLNKLRPGHAIYSTLLTAQGRFLFDFFIIEHENGYLLDVEAARAADLLRRLKMFKLRSNVDMAETDYHVLVSMDGGLPSDGFRFKDPRLDILGIRAFVKGGEENKEALFAYDEKRMALGVPEGGIELIPEKSILLENGLDELQAIDWDKGCYMGQELTARTRYRGLVRKRLLPMKVKGAVPPADQWQGEKAAVFSFSPSGETALGMLRLEQLGELQADGFAIGATRFYPYVPDWMRLPKLAEQGG